MLSVINFLAASLWLVRERWDLAAGVLLKEWVSVIEGYI
jgi:hypothetical protein